jgi:siroheme synthase-like protein
MRSDVFAVGLRLEGKLCLVIGNGEEAERRARALVAAGAAVNVVTTRPTAEMERLAGAGVFILFRRAFLESDLAGVWLAVYTDPDAAEALRIGEQANAARVFFCALDQPAASSYSHLALAKAGPVTVAISTNGRAPALARRLRDEIDRVFTAASLQEYAESLADLRDRTPRGERRSVLGAAVMGVRVEGRLVLPVHDEAEGSKRS